MVILNEASDHALEIDGPEGSAPGRFTLDGLTLIGTNDECAPTGVDGGADYRKGATGDNNNIYVTNTVEKDIELDKADDNAAYMAGTLTFAGFEFTPANTMVLIVLRLI